MPLSVRRLLLAITLGAPLACADDGSGPRGPLALDIVSAPDSLLRSESPRLVAGVVDANGNAVRGQPLSYRSLDEDVLTVDSRGRITPIGLGSTRIIVSSGGMEDTTDAITVYATYRAKIDEGAAEVISMGAEMTLGASMIDDLDETVAGPTFAWSSSNPAAASVGTNGMVTGAGPGPAWIRVEAEAPDGATSRDSVLVRVNARYIAIEAGGETTCALTPDRRAWCWGANEHSELGVGDRENRETPTLVAGGLRFATLSPGFWHTCGIEYEPDGDGAAWCWGSNSDGQLGNGQQNTWSMSPTKASGDLQFTQISAGKDNSCGLTRGGELYCWGNFFNGIPVSAVPSRVAIPGPVVTVSTGWHWTACAVNAAGLTYCFGLNDWYQLARENRSARVADTISGGHRFVAVQSGWFHGCGLRPDGVALCWGEDKPLADTSASYVLRWQPEPIDSDLRFTRLSARSISTCGLTASGEVYCWGGGSGSGSRGYVGIETNRPTKIAGPVALSTLSAGQWHACGMGSDARAYCWGRSFQGALGEAAPPNTLTMIPAPYQQ